MIEKSFIILSQAVEGNPVAAICASFIWGILSLILSPCHLSSIPLIVGFIDGQGRISAKRALLISSCFSVGIMLSIGVIGLITALAGRMMGDVGAYGNFFVSGIFFLVGLNLLDILPIPWTGPGNVSIKKKGLFASFILGSIFGIALGPCTFAYMAPMLGVTFKLAATQIWYGIFLLLIYAVGHCSIIVLAGTFTEVVQQYLNWDEKSKGSIIIKRVCGFMIILGGIYLIYTSL